MIKSELRDNLEYTTDAQVVTGTLSNSVYSSDNIVALLLTCAIADIFDVSLDFDFGPSRVYKALQPHYVVTDTETGTITPALLLAPRQYTKHELVEKISSWGALRSIAAYYAALYLDGANYAPANDLEAECAEWLKAITIPAPGDVGNNASNILLKKWVEKSASSQYVTPKVTCRFYNGLHHTTLTASKELVDFFSETVYNSKLHQSLWLCPFTFNYEDLQYCLSMEEKH